ncbi:MAG TPA: hypothetical protein VJ656_00105 [Pyrinomonadaceae bacterium]|nr:hypothetical protein [Pyrinomonadaceae bacterium]
MKRFMLTVALTCILSVSSLAGEMPGCGVASTTPPPAVAAADGPGEAPTAPPADRLADPGILEMLILAIITWP